MFIQNVYEMLVRVARILNNRGSYISAHVLLNLLNELRKRSVRLCQAFYHFSATCSINSIIQKHEHKILFII